MKNSSFRRNLARLAGFACTVLFVSSLTSCKDELLTGQPSWLGSSIYEELEDRGTFSETLKLIAAQEDDYVSILKRTGSKTLFVADDNAWKRFYDNNAWGVKSIDEMSPAQKKILFKGNMINSAYLIELLGNVPLANSEAEAIEGTCMRRESSVDILDSMPVVEKKDYPVVNNARLDIDGNVIDYWARVRDKESIVLFQDNHKPNMIHFMPKFMQNNKVTDEDVEFLTGGELTKNTQAFVNGVAVSDDHHDITCQNGYIHVMEEVPVQFGNLFNVIGQDPDLSIYYRLLQRFSYPEYNYTLSKEYERVTGIVDSVYVLRFFNEHGSYAYATTQDNDLYNSGKTVSAKLPYDPAWNTYALYTAGGNVTYQNDAAVILVPSNQAMKDYLAKDGADIQEKYGRPEAGDGETAWDNAPDAVILPLLKNTMLTSLRAAIPSQFGSINNTAADPMGVTKADIDKVLWANNGVAYKTNKVFLSPEYVSVFFPCIYRADDDLSIIYAVVMDDGDTSTSDNTLAEGFYAYLLNMAKNEQLAYDGYSFIIPSDNALQTYYDPVTRYRIDESSKDSTAMLYSFKLSKKNHIDAEAAFADWSNLDEYNRPGRVEITSNYDKYKPASGTGKSEGLLFNRMKDIINSSLATTLFHNDQEIYHAKNGTPIIVKWDGDKVVGVAGSFQYERGYFIPVEGKENTVDKSKDGNGRSYIIDQEPIMSTFTSPYSILSSEENVDKFGSFASLIKTAGLDNDNDGAKHCTMDRAIKLFNNYHYTMYVPEESTVNQLIKDKKLPSADLMTAIENVLGLTGSLAVSEEEKTYLEAQQDTLKILARDFVSYHVQDNATYIGGEACTDKQYESSCLDAETKRFVKLTITNDNSSKALTITDNLGNKHNVDTTPGNYNIMSRQFYFNTEDLASASEIYSSAFVVMHVIDSPLEPNTHCYLEPEKYAKIKEILDAHPIKANEKLEY